MLTVLSVRNKHKNEDEADVSGLFRLHGHGQEVLLVHAALDFVGDQKTRNQRKGDRFVCSIIHGFHSCYVN